MQAASENTFFKSYLLTGGPLFHAHMKKVATEIMVCQQEGGSRCSIDHSQFADGDNVCSCGHVIGQEYAVPA